MGKRRVMMPAPSSAPAAEENTDEPESTPEKPVVTLTPEQTKALFVRYEKAMEQRRELEELVKQKEYECSEAVKEILEKIGRGPFEWKGKLLVAMRRGDTAFFKTEGTREVMKIE